MEPRVQAEQDGAARANGRDRWIVRWKIHNLGEAPLSILAARLPHGKFRSDEKSIDPPLEIASGETGRIEIEARCADRPGAEVENAFVILRVTHAGAPWLILARLRITVDNDGTPNSATELITVQPVGFSERQASQRRW
ncbi:MAG TPA: hypothetical protein VHL99_07180 [Candidatus Binatia bacterium]|jgi:hypothetical protein|nr:hypothetical protein [Candidatus Binatia bacterium]